MIEIIIPIKNDPSIAREKDKQPTNETDRYPGNPYNQYQKHSNEAIHTCHNPYHLDYSLPLQT